MKHSKLSDHILKKGKFITPINSIPFFKELEDDKTWAYGRLPEYLWIGLILKRYGHIDGIKKCLEIINLLHKYAPNLEDIRLSSILKLDKDTQSNLYEQMIKIVDKDVLTPLTIFLKSSNEPVFAKAFVDLKYSVEARCNTIIETMRDTIGHQTNEATDIRYIVIYYALICNKITIDKVFLEDLEKYSEIEHSEISDLLRSSIRSLELTLVNNITADSSYINEFWRCISEMTDCELYVFEHEKENRDITKYMNALREIYSYYIDLYKSGNLLDEKMKVILGIATYSYRRFKEAYEHNLFNTISGRNCVRVMIENYIMMKYLIKNESINKDIWKEYQYYGIGQYKKILLKYREKTGLEGSHFSENYINALVNEYKEEEFINMDTSYFNHDNIRKKAESVDEKELHDLYYDYDSAFEHGLWGAIRETSLSKCNNPAHKYHCVPDINSDINLSSVLPDCIMIMNKTITFLDKIYKIPDKTLREATNFEIKPITRKDIPNSK